MTTKALERQVGRVFSPRAHCGPNVPGDLANSKILTAMSLFGFLLLRNSAVSIATALMSR